jgi:excisionase family DNA binding protein
METIATKKPSKKEQELALNSYEALASLLKKLSDENPFIEIIETKDQIQLPLISLKLLKNILKELSMGKLISIVPIAAEVSTQVAAEILGCSRPHIVKLLETGKIEFSKVGKHRRIKYEDLMNYKKKTKAHQRKLLKEIMKADEESGLYDS